ncbi:MAG TPA: hypothetical protein VGD98_08800 [Ktedonobacteraceae bacterium]
MYNPYGDRQARRAQRRYDRDTRRYARYQNPMRGLAGAVVLLALIIGFAFNGAWGGSAFLVLLFVGLAFASLFGAFSTGNSNSIYGGMYGFIWMLGLALCFLIGFWPWILLPVVVSIILGTFFRQIMGGLAGASFMASPQMQPPYQQSYPPQEQPPYQQPYPPQEQPPYQGYQQGYQGPPAQPHETYQENSQPYEQAQPQTPNPEQKQELPPMEQH